MGISDLTVWNWRPPGFTNFGDEIGLAILDELHIPYKRVRKIENAELVTVGSVLEIAQAQAKSGTKVWGAGFIQSGGVMNTRLDIRLVRGRMTRSRIVASVPTGDPALLASRFWDAAEKQHEIGYVPHYVDKTDYSGYTIDVRRDPREVVRDISSCKKIVTSSLHGAIIAESYGIPYEIVHHPKVVGNGYKFKDFKSSLDDSIENIQDRIVNAFPI